jgi:parvulin-like peptidyl-prolyl isomerase
MANEGVPRLSEKEFARSGRGGMVKAFGDVSFRLNVGETGMTVFHADDSPYGWHIIKRIK